MKKKIPLALLQLLEKELLEYQKFVDIVFPDDSYITFRDKDASSVFYFLINGIYYKNGIAEYSVSYSPVNEFDLSEVIEESIHETVLKNRIEDWISLLKEYDKPSPFFDDPITQHYYEELNPYFEILDEDGDQKPFPMLQQQLLTNYYELLIEEVIKNKDEENAAEAETVVIELKQAQKAVSKSTKKTVIRTLQRNIAKLWKFSAQVGAKAIASLAEEGVKEALKTAGLKAAEIAMKLLG